MALYMWRVWVKQGRWKIELVIDIALRCTMHQKIERVGSLFSSSSHIILCCTPFFIRFKFRSMRQWQQQWVIMFIFFIRIVFLLFYIFFYCFFCGNFQSFAVFWNFGLLFSLNFFSVVFLIPSLLLCILYMPAFMT